MIWLFEVVVRSSAILLVGLALMPLLRRQSAALRHWVLAATLFSSGIIPLVMWVVPEWEAPVSVATLVPPPVARSIETFVSEQDARVVNDAAVSTTTDPAPFTLTSRSAWQIWVSGAALWLLALAGGLWHLRRLDRGATRVSHGVWRDAIAAAKLRGVMPDGVSVRMTHRPSLLLVWGVRQPTIIVPLVTNAWPLARAAAVLDHELAHIRRRDWPLQIAAEVVRALYWFNPLVWITCARLRTECEVACDDIVITEGAAGADFASHVVAIAKELNTRSWLPAPAIVRRSSLEWRIRAMLDKNRNRQPLTGRARNAAAIVIASITLSVAAIAAQSFVTLSGTIVDPSNGVLPGVTLALTNDQTHAKYEIKTDRNGKYEFVGLPPGSYTMQAVLPGFSRFSGRVTVASQNLQQDLTMTLGMLQETITLVSRPANDSTATVVTVAPEVLRKVEERRQKAQRACPSVTTSDGTPVGGNIRVPIKLRDVKPIYPATLQDTAGKVVLVGRINTEGAVDQIEVVSSTHNEFTDATIAAVSQWLFDATVLNCEPVSVQMQVTANYRVTP